MEEEFVLFDSIERLAKAIVIESRKATLIKIPLS